MKHTQQNLEYSEKRRGRSLDATGAGPYIKLFAALLALILAALAIIFVIIPSLKGSIDWDAAFMRRTPAPDTEAAATPLAPALISSRVQSLALDAERGEAVLVDAAIHDGALICASGPDEESCDRILRVDLESGKHKTVAPTLENDCLRMPRESGEYLVWFDAKNEGGGNICVRNEKTGAELVLVRLESGLPALRLDGQYLIFTADAGTAVKLYAVDLASYEPLTLALLENDGDAVSAPDIQDGRVCYLSDGLIHLADLVNGGGDALAVDGSVHDPAFSSGGLIWLSGNHGEDTDLYYRSDDGTLLILARGVINAAPAAGCVAYGRDGTVYAYSFDSESFYMLSGAEEYAQLVAAGGDYALWRVLSEDGVSYRYLKVN